MFDSDDFFILLLIFAVLFAIIIFFSVVYGDKPEKVDNSYSSSSVSMVSSCDCSAIPSESESCNCRRCEK